MEFLGKAVSIHCTDELGVFQGTIRSADPDSLTIVRAFRNGLPVRTLDTEITIKASDIISLQLIASANVAETAPSTNNNSLSNSQSVQTERRHAQSQNGQNVNNTMRNGGTGATLANGIATKELRHNRSNQSPVTAMTNNAQRHQPGQRSTPRQKITYQATNNNYTASQNNNSINLAAAAAIQPHQLVQKHFAHMIPAKVEVMHGSASTSLAAAASYATPTNTPLKSAAAVGQQMLAASQTHQQSQSQQRTASNRKTAAYARNHAFAQSADDPLLLDEEFDFEKNLALFDKRAIWDEIDAIQKPDLMRQTAFVKPKNYRHDENILPSMPAASSRQIATSGRSSGQHGSGIVEFTTDDGLVIPTVPMAQRMAVQMAAQRCGLTCARQCDMLARGTTEMALMLLGGARRLTPQNQHQWPTIVVVCDENEPWCEPGAETGLATGRHLASHGLAVCVYGNGAAAGGGSELALFDACGSSVWRTSVVKELPSCDLVILAVQSPLKPSLAKWVNDNRSPTLAIDPPIQHAAGIAAAAGVPLGVAIKHSILPVLPLNGIEAAHGGKLYLCNLGIPERFYVEAGIQYRSPFGHKFVIPIHPLTSTEASASSV